MIEAGRPITLHTLLRISDVLSIAPEDLVAGLYVVVPHQNNVEGKE